MCTNPDCRPWVARILLAARVADRVRVAAPAVDVNVVRLVLAARLGQTAHQRASKALTPFARTAIWFATTILRTARGKERPRFAAPTVVIHVVEVVRYTVVRRPLRLIQ